MTDDPDTEPDVKNDPVPEAPQPEPPAESEDDGSTPPTEETP